MWELGYGCQLALWQWLCQHRSLLHYDVVVQVLCIIRLELCYMYHTSYFHVSGDREVAHIGIETGGTI